MLRNQRINENGFYHVINIGVAKSVIFGDGYDFEKFLDITEEASSEYKISIFSFCLMDNHYHLLLKINQQNLSLVIQKINFRYGIYFNKKYKRIGTLWQGRFKSWYIHDSLYLQTLVKYIEVNPIQANIVKDFKKYKWTMSSFEFKYDMLDFSLIKKIDFTKKLSQEEIEKIDDLYYLKQNTPKTKQTKIKPLSSYFSLNSQKEIHKALRDGHSATSVAKFLSISNALVTKRMKNYKQKKAFFEKLKLDKVFYSYDKEITYDDFSDELIVEYALKYADFDDIKKLIEIFSINYVKKIWHKTVKNDKNFIRVNLLMARVLFNMDIESDYLKKAKNERLEKFKQLVR